MSFRRMLSVLFLALCCVSLISATAVAQDEVTPKWDLFVGYQWLHPGITVPAPFQPVNQPIGVKMGDIPQGAGAARCDGSRDTEIGPIGGHTSNPICRAVRHRAVYLE